MRDCTCSAEELNRQNQSIFSGICIDLYGTEPSGRLWQALWLSVQSWALEQCFTFLLLSPWDTWLVWKPIRRLLKTVPSACTCVELDSTVWGSFIKLNDSFRNCTFNRKQKPVCLTATHESINDKMTTYWRTLYERVIQHLFWFRKLKWWGLGLWILMLLQT